MTRNARPRKAYRPRPVRADTLAIAAGAVAKPSQEDRAQLVQMLEDAVKALREGVATELQWSVAAGFVQMAKAIERMRIVRGLAEHFASADAALQGIYNRAMATHEWRPTALYYQELDALQTFVDLYRFQLDQLSRNEISRAADLARHLTHKAGHTATVARTAEQLQLAGVPA